MNSVLISFISFTTSIVKRVCVYTNMDHGVVPRGRDCLRLFVDGFLRGKTIAQ